MKRLLIGAALAAFATSATAHDWYPLECCSEQDCSELVESKPEIGPSGQFTGGAFLTNKQGLVGYKAPTLVPRASPDGKDHVCIFKGYVLCWFTGQGT